MNFTLHYCNKCIQMTNHTCENGFFLICAKCKNLVNKPNDVPAFVDLLLKGKKK